MHCKSLRIRYLDENVVAALSMTVIMQRGDINSIVMLHYCDKLMTLHLKYYLDLGLSGKI